MVKLETGNKVDYGKFWVQGKSIITQYSEYYNSIMFYY